MEIKISEITELKIRSDEVNKNFELLKSQHEVILAQKNKVSEDLANKNALLTTTNQKLSEVQSDLKLLQGTYKSKEDELSNNKEKYIILNANAEQALKKHNELQAQVETQKSAIQQKDADVQKLKEEKAAWENMREKMLQDHQNKMNEITAIIKSYEDEKQRIRHENDEKQKLFLKEREREWKEHENKVKIALQSITERMAIEIPKTYPFQGEPDNCIMIKNQYVIFDAKAPKNIDSPENIDNYVSVQAKKLNKYTKESSVRKEVFLVVPDGALPFIKNFYFELEGKKVFVIPMCSLEPMIRNMKLIEDYEFAERLCPEERDSIIHFIGKSVYTMKRKIQVDQVFNHKFFELLNDRKQLPEEFLSQATKKETTMLVSLPQDRTTKVIKEEDLEKSSLLIDTLMEKEEIPPFNLDELEDKKVG